MVIINVGIGTEKKATSKLSITLDDSYAEEINAENVVFDIHTVIWRYLRGWTDRGVAVTIKTEAVE